MAPRKEKTEKVSADEAADTVLSYLRKQKYPAVLRYGHFSKPTQQAAAAKILKEMHERKEIEGRAAGSRSYTMSSRYTQQQHLPRANGKDVLLTCPYPQNSEDAATPEDLQAMDEEIQRLRDETSQAKAMEKTLRSTLSNTNATLSTADLRASVAALEAERAEVIARLGPLRTGSVRSISAEEKAGVDAELRKWEKVEKARAKIAKEMWGMIHEGLSETKAGELRERLGLDE
ncbi:hypothetical protein H2199_002072 [Coniosporium tulheliwenetii]|uniref:Uncharacterized protein n=1 Tax=Coniosporium tulheliwenetii TaxID=3383036 RepID=A0ACC2ZHS4_9PEZI|nr:hypothetical protein H2199_002072 [Cladosporium sp. JES 115]